MDIGFVAPGLDSLKTWIDAVILEKRTAEWDEFVRDDANCEQDESLVEQYARMFKEISQKQPKPEK
jgi:hypothetical protein